MKDMREGGGEGYADVSESDHMHARGRAIVNTQSMFMVIILAHNITGLDRDLLGLLKKEPIQHFLQVVLQDRLPRKLGSFSFPPSSWFKVDPPGILQRCT